MSGRRSSSEAGRPAGTTGGCGCAVTGRPRGTGAGFCPSRMLTKFSCCSIRRSRSGMAAAAVKTSSSDCRTSSMEAAPCASWLFTRSRDSRRDRSVRSEISSSRSSSRSWKYAPATSATSVVRTAWRPHSLAKRLARAASVARRNRPQKSSSHASDRLPSRRLLSNAEKDRPPGPPGDCAVRWRAAWAAPVSRGNWSARVTPSCAWACRTRAAAMRASQFCWRAAAMSCRSCSSWKTSHHFCSPSAAAPGVVASPAVVPR